MVGHQLFLCLGGNLGNKAEIFDETLGFLKNKIGNLIRASSLFSSPAWGFESENKFWNQVILLETTLSPLAVVHEIRIIENHFDRKREPGIILSRKMDIDILFYDDLVLNSEKLTIPHPLIGLRNFVLVPLAEIAPELVHPVSKETIKEMILKCLDKSIITPLSFRESDSIKKSG
jgi:2-amino-4-hydroxy-6-hydroxymethyldihydropteridine diphosphokinase